MSDTGTRQRFLGRMFRGPDPVQEYHGVEQTPTFSNTLSPTTAHNEKQHGVDGESDVTEHDAQDTANEAMNKVERLERQQHRMGTNVELLHEERKRDKKAKRDWYPWVLFAIAVNFFLWISMLYAIFEADFWSHNKSLYLTYAWLIVIVPLLVASFFIFSPVPGAMKVGRERFSETVASPQAKNFINILNAAACFIASATYVFHGAVPQYNKIDWNMSVDFVNDLPIPAVAILIATEDTSIVTNDVVGSAWFSDGFGDYYQYASNGVYLFNGSDYGYDNNKLLVWNSTASPNATITDATDQYLWLQTNVTFNSTANAEYDLLGEPQIFVAAFDPRISVSQMLDCGFQPWYSMNAFSTNSYSILANYITDTLHSVQAPRGSPDYCRDVFHDKLSQRNFSLYDMRLSASSPNYPSYRNDCDIVTNPDARCQLQINLSYGSQFVLTRQSAHSISKLEIWLNISAIVGAIQFFAWFALQAVGG